MRETPDKEPPTGSSRFSTPDQTSFPLTDRATSLSANQSAGFLMTSRQPILSKVFPIIFGSARTGRDQHRPAAASRKPLPQTGIDRFLPTAEELLTLAEGIRLRQDGAQPVRSQPPAEVPPGDRHRRESALLLHPVRLGLPGADAEGTGAVQQALHGA
ncbi:hypothetical protein Bbelb_246760, partial [Branchiostoma belcheri]